MDPWQPYINYINNQPHPTDQNPSNPQRPIIRPPMKASYIYENQAGQYMYHTPPPNSQPLLHRPQNDNNEENVPETQFEHTPAFEEQDLSTQEGSMNMSFGEEESPTSSRRRDRFSVKEDTLLIQSWLNISKDSSVGNDQRSARFWDRIVENYNNYREHLEWRTSQQLKPRFYRMSKEVSLFVGCYKEANNPPKSGYCEKDYLVDASALYHQSTNKKFTYEHAWRLLKDEPKWRGEAMPNGSRRQRNSEDGAYTSSSNQQTSARPQGQRAAKRKGKEKQGNESSKSSNLSTSEALLQERNDLMNRWIETFDASKKSEKMRFYYEILTRDTSSMSEEQLAHHKDFCKDAKKEWDALNK